MKRKLLLSILLLALGHLAHAQTPDSVFYRHHIGLNTRIVLDRLIDPDSRMPLQLMYKYQLSPNGAVRIGAEGLYAKSDSTRSFTDRSDKVTNYLLGGSVGYEWQKPLNKIFMLYYGADAFYRHQGKNIEILNRYAEPYPSQYQVDDYVDDRLSTLSAGLKPFVGLRANIGSKFYLSAETALKMSRETNTWDFKGYIKFSSPEGGSTQTTTIGYKTQKVIASYLPVTGFNLHYMF